MSKADLEKAKWHLMLVIRPDEQLVWYYRPPPWAEALVPGLRCLFMLIWTLLALGISVYSFFHIATSHAPNILYITALSGAALSAFGVTVLVWNVWLVLAAWSTFYGVSSARFIVLKSIWPGKVMSLRKGWLQCAESGTKFPYPNILLSGRGNGRNVPDRLRIWVKKDQADALRVIREALSP